MTKIACRENAIAVARDQNLLTRDQDLLARDQKRFAIQTSEVKSDVIGLEHL